MKPVTTQSGFTIIELMIAVSIAAILMGIGVPAMRNMLITQDVKTSATEIHLALVYARSEAIKRRVNIDIDPSGTNNWAGGWEVKIQSSGTVLKTQDALSGTMSVTGANSGTAPGTVTFNKLGRVTTAADFEVKVTGNTLVRMRCVSVTLSGRAYTETDTDGNLSNGCQ